MKCPVAALVACLLLTAACDATSSPPPAASPAESAPIAASYTPSSPLSAPPACIIAGGMCVGPAAMAANPSAPCAAGMHRVDRIAADDPQPPCLGIPTGEEACCMPDRR